MCVDLVLRPLQNYFTILRVKKITIQQINKIGILSPKTERKDNYPFFVFFFFFFFFLFFFFFWFYDPFRMVKAV